MQLAEFLSGQGWSVRESFGTTAQGIGRTVLDVYNTLNERDEDGQPTTDAIVVFDGYADEDRIAATVAGVEEYNDASESNVVVWRNTDSYTKGKKKGQAYPANVIRDRIDARNSASHDENTLGRVSFSDPIFDGGDLRGFSITRA